MLTYRTLVATYVYRAAMRSRSASFCAVSLVASVLISGDGLTAFSFNDWVHLPNASQERIELTAKRGIGGSGRSLADSGLAIVQRSMRRPLTVSVFPGKARFS